jgi:hypothetical protein
VSVGSHMSTVCTLCIALTLDASLTQLLWQGIFWMTKDEFFRYFPTIFLSASDMPTFVMP